MLFSKKTALDGITTHKNSISPILILGTILLLIAISLLGYFFYKYQKSQSLLLNPQKAAQEEAKTLVNAVGKLIELPNDETPTMATVSDSKKLSSQPFFKNAQNGDKVLIYTKNKKAILYRPSSNKIIEVAPINISDTQPTKLIVPTEVIPTSKTTKINITPISTESATTQSSITATQ